MKTDEVLDIFASLPSGGMITSDTRLRRGSLLAMVNTLKNASQRMVYMQTKSIPPAWYVPYYPVFQKEWGGSCYKRFKMVDYVILDGIVSGIGYIGAERMNHTFTVMTNRIQLTDYMLHPILKPRKNETYVLIENGYLEIYGQPVTNFIMGIIPTNPLNVPTFSYENDEYPIDEGLLDVMKKTAMNPDINLLTKTPVDRVQDGLDQTAINSSK